MVIAFSFSLNAQNRKAIRPAAVSGAKKVQALKSKPINDNKSQFAATFNSTPALLPVAKDVNAINKVLISHSANCYSYYNASQQTVMSSNSDLNLITFTARKSLSNIVPGSQTNQSGFCQANFSTDFGTSWDTTLVPYRDTAANVSPGRYPSGVIYNPAGNTNVLNASSVVCGIKQLPNTNWSGDYFASETFGHANNSIKKSADNDTSFLYFLTSCDAGKFHVIGDHNRDNGTNWTRLQSVLWDGSWNNTTNSVDWTSTIHNPPFTVNTNGTIYGSGEYAYAWSKDGQIGYHIYTGVSSSAGDPKEWAPIVYKSTNAGASWNLMAPFIFTSIPAIDSSLFEISTGVRRAFFDNPSDAVVDLNGNLHLAQIVRSASSVHPDSLNYYMGFAKIEGYMFDVFTTTAAGGWDANYIETQYGQDLLAADDTQWGCGWSNRLQMSKSPDGKKIFYTWMDSDTNNIVADNLNRYPDILSVGYDVVTGDWSNYGIPKNFTKGGIYDGSNYFMCAGDWTFSNAGTYTLHVSTMQPGATGDAPVDHYYVKNVNFTENDFVGINEISNGIGSISQNYPNPTSGLTTINVNLTKSSKLSLVVTNLMGQKVYELAASTVAAGTHALTIDASKLSSGVYFYTVNADNNSITKKMIVE